MELSPSIWLGVIAAVGLDWLLIRWLRRKRLTRASPGEVRVLGQPSPALTWLKQRQAALNARLASLRLGQADSGARLRAELRGAPLAPTAGTSPGGAPEPARPSEGPIEVESAADPAPTQPLPAQVAAFLIVAGVLIVFGTQWARWRTPGSSWSDIALTLGGMALFLLGVRLSSNEAAGRWLFRPLTWLGSRLRVSASQVLCLALSPLLTVLATAAAGFAPEMRNPGVAIAAWAAAIGLAVYGGWRPGEKPLSIPRDALAWALALSLVALAVRAVALGSLPDTLSGDEGASGLDSAAFVRGARDNPFVASWQSWPALHPALNAVSVALFGQSMAALRLPSAVAGALTVGVLYLAARAMFGLRAAWVAAAYLIVSALHVQWSRTALNNIWDGLVYTLTLGALWYGWQTGRRQMFLLAGLAWGFCLYFYASARALVILVPLVIAVIGWLDRPRLRRSLPDLVAMGAVAFAVVWPIAWFFLNYWELFLGPMKLVSVLGPWLEFNVRQSGQPAWLILLRQLGLGLQAYTFTPLIGWLPDTILLTPAAAALFLLGVALLVSRRREARAWVPLLWLLTFSLVAAFSVNTPQHWRFIGVLPACALVVGFGADQVLALAGRLWRPLARLAGPLALALTAVMGAAEARVFWDYNFHFDNAGYGAATATRLGNYLRAKSGDWQVAYYGWPRLGWGSIPSLQYLAPHVTGYDMTLPDGSLNDVTLTSDRLVFVFLTAQVERLDEVRAQYPGGRTLRETWPYEDKLLYWLYEYDAAAAR